MHEYTYKNHFKFGYNGNWFNERHTSSDVWNIEYGKCSRPIYDWKTECIETAKLIRKSTELPLYVMLSGGIDSEVVARSFKVANIPFKAAITRFKDDLNKHDIDYAIRFCKNFEIEYDLYDLDILDFWYSNRVLEYGEIAKALSPQLTTTMWLMDQIDGYPILGSGECYVHKLVDASYIPGESDYVKTNWAMWERERIASWYRFLMKKNREGCPGFFQYTPEIMAAFLIDPIVQDMVDDQLHGKLSTVTTKFEIYNTYWYDLELRPKYHGFENVEDHDWIIRKGMKEKWGNWDTVIDTEYHSLVNHLLHDNKPIYTIKPLTLNDKQAVVDMYIKEHNHKKETIVESNFQRFEYIMDNYYLPYNKSHKIFGLYHNNELIATVAARMDIPDAWSITNLRIYNKHNVHIKKIVGLDHLLRTVYNYAERHGKKKYYTCMISKRYNTYNKIFSELIPEFYNKYTHSIILEIPPNTKPEQDLFWGMVGRKLWDNPLIIKQGQQL